MGDLVWYVAYGSNLCRERLQRYLDQGPDPTPPRADHPLTIGHPLFFAGESRVWGGGRAYVDHEVVEPAATLARAWLLTTAQWSALHARESSREVDATLVPGAIGAGEVRIHGAGRYDTVIGFDRHDDHPVVTFTGPDRLDPAACRAPVADYLRTIATGLSEAHGLGPDEAARYLAGAGGVAPTWTEVTLVALLVG